MYHDVPSHDTSVRYPLNPEKIVKMDFEGIKKLISIMGLQASVSVLKEHDLLDLLEGVDE